jgi:hypothetical protein
VSALLQPDRQLEEREQVAGRPSGDDYKMRIQRWSRSRKALLLVILSLFIMQRWVACHLSTLTVTVQPERAA